MVSKAAEHLAILTKMAKCGIMEVSVHFEVIERSG